MKRRLLALTLTLAMALSVLSIAAFAEGEQDYPEMFLDTPVAVTWNGGRGSQFLFVAPETGYYTLTTYNKEEYNEGWLITAHNLDEYPYGDSAAYTTGFTHFMLKGGRYVYSSGADVEHGYSMSLSKTTGFEEFVSDAQEWNVGTEPEKTVTMPAATVTGYLTFKAIKVRFPETGRYRMKSGTTGGFGAYIAPILLNETGDIITIGKAGFPSVFAADVKAGDTYYLLPGDLWDDYDVPYALSAYQVDPAVYCTDGSTHSFREEIAVKKATMTEDGEVTVRCIKCGREETEELPAIGSIKLYGTSFYYDGTEMKPEGYILDKNGDSLHWLYGYPQNVEYTDNINAGTATAKITIDNGYYEGEAILPFQILPLILDDASNVTLSTTNYTYNGSAKKPGVTVKEGTKTLQANTDYTVTYAAGRINAGTYKVTVTGKGNYTGTISKTFTIKSKALTASNVTLSTTNYTYNGSAKKPGVTVTDGTKNLVKDRDYTVAYKYNTNAGTATVTVTGKGNYTGTVSKSLTIKPKALVASGVTLSTVSYTYNGSAKKPGVTVKDGTKTLVRDTDYTVAYKNNTNAGTATVTVAGKGNYTATITKSFTIKPKAITPTATLSKTAFVYNGKVQKPTVTVKDGSTKLTSANYTVTWPSGCKIVGTYKPIVKLKGNYSGSKTVSYKINPKATTMSKVTAASKAFTATWNKQAAQTTGYQIQYSLNSTFASGNKTALITKNTTLSKKVTGLTAKKKYYVRVRTYKTVGSTKYYSPWSKALAVTTKA